MRPDQEPVESEGSLGDKAFDHPAFGMIAASRVTGSSTLYGSDFVHHHYVTVTIRSSTLNRGLTRDWHYGGKELIEVKLSEAQWATFVSSMNVGSGVPCTLSHQGGKLLPGIPHRKQRDVVEGELKAALEKVSQLLRDAAADVDEVVGQNVSGKKREAILERLRQAHRVVSDHLPFAADSFRKNMENIEEAAKVEVNAYIQSAVHRAGLKALRGGAQDEAPLQLNSGENE